MEKDNNNNDKKPELPVKRVMMVGDAGSGMTAMLMAYKDNKTPNFDGYYDRQWNFAPFRWAPPGYAPVDIDWMEEDPPSRRAAPMLRLPMYTIAQIIVIFFSIGNPDTLEHVRTVWAPEVLGRTGGSRPIVLIGCKSDLRTDPDTIDRLKEKSQAPVTTKQGQAVANEIKAYKYLECSAKTMVGIKEAVEYCNDLARQDIIIEDEAELRASRAGERCIIL